MESGKENILERNRLQAEGLWANGKPRKWYYAIPVVLFLIILFAFLLKILL